MKFHSIFAVLIVSILIGCSPIPRPTPFLNERRMVELLTEMQLIEATLQQKQNQGANFDSMRLYTTAAYADLFERFGLTQESFEANLFYRTYRSRDLERIYTKVRDNLEQMNESKVEIQQKDVLDEVRLFL